MIFITISCNDDYWNTEKRSIERSKINIEVMLNKTLLDNIDSIELILTNVSSKQKLTFNRLNDILIPIGLYDCQFSGYCKQDTVYQKIKAVKQSIKILDNSSTFNLNAYKSLKNEGFVFEELFFTGVLTPQGKQYYGCSYFKITNNSDKLLYADSLAICESRFLTVRKWNYEPNIMHEAFAANAIYMIPGSGKDVPVKPGESLLIADIAMDHTKVIPTAYDLSNADFEWFDDSPHPRVQDIDNPNVPNLDKIYCYTLTIWVPHNRGFKTYALAKIKEKKEDYLKNYLYEYDYLMILPQGTFPMSGKAYKIPNNWIVDAVNVSIESKYVWNLVVPELDAGWTNCGKIDHDKKRYNKSCIRKVKTVLRNGRRILQDTNNSTDDFIPEARPSMMPEGFEKKYPNLQKP